MQSIFNGEVAFLRNAEISCGYNFLPSYIPYGNDFEDRAYDPALMRFARPDAMEEKYPGKSSF